MNRMSKAILMCEHCVVFSEGLSDVCGLPYTDKVHSQEAQPLPALTDEEYLAKAEKFLADAAKMNNAPVPYMIAAAFKNEDRAKRAESELSRLTGEPDGIGWCSSCDRMHEVQRPKCPTCGDWLVFAADDAAKEEQGGWIDCKQQAVSVLEWGRCRDDHERT